MNQPDTCALCGATAKLSGSHVFPDFFIKSLEREIPVGQKGGTQKAAIVLSTRPEIKSGQKLRGKWEKKFGFKEKLLCEPCERKFSKYEHWFREFFYSNKPSPLKKQPVGTVLKIENDFRTPKIHEAREVIVDYQKFKLFILSLVWRASKSKGDFFRGISLGDQHEARLRILLMGEDPGPEDCYMIVMMDLRLDGEGIEDYIEQPSISKDEENHRFCQLVIGGFMFIIYIGSQDHAPPHDAKVLGLRASGRLLLVAMEDTERLNNWVRKFGNAGLLSVPFS